MKMIEQFPIILIEQHPVHYNEVDTKLLKDMSGLQ